MVSDANKGITSISYNHLNLPTFIAINSDIIAYIYDSTGNKLQKTVGSSVTEYAGNHIYNGNSSSTTLQFFGQPEGYIMLNGSGGYDYVYQYKDHLGNVRLSYQDINNDGSVDRSEILQERNYYPFGLEHRGYNGNVQGVENNYMTYNGKELDESLGLDWYDYGERNYDAAIGRFMNMDLYAHNYMKYSPYGYVLNNPINNVDYKGKFVLPKEFVEKYGRLAHYLKNDIQGLLGNKRIVVGLKKFGGFTDAQLKEAFTYGEGPKINVVQLDNMEGKSGKEVLGFTSVGSSMDIDVDLIENLENATGRDRDYLLFLTAVTILHKLVHIGDRDNEVTDPMTEYDRARSRI